MRMNFFTLFTFFLLLSGGNILNGQAPKFLSCRQTGADAATLTWNYPNSGTSYPIDALTSWTPNSYWDIPASNSSFSDGRHLYIISGGGFQKYDFEGNFMETIQIPNLPLMMQVTSDGEYFYGVADGGMSGKYGIYKFDLEKKELIKIIPTPIVLLHITYIPELDNGRGGFEAGNPDRGYYFTMEGEYIGAGPDFDFDNNGATRNTAYYDGKLYTFQQTPGGSLKVIYEYDIETNEATGNKLDLTQFADSYGFTASQMAISLNFFEDLQKGTMNAAAITYWTASSSSGYRIGFFEIGQRPVLEALQGYNVYRNDVKRNTVLVTATDFSYEDTGLEEGIEYTYTVTSVYAGTESEKSNPATIYFPYTNLLPLAEDFSSESFDTNSWTVFTDNIQSAWSIVNNQTVLGDDLPSLAYSYRFNRDYNQTVTSKPLGIATDGLTLMRFDAYCTLKQTEQCNIEILIGEAWQIVHTIDAWAASGWMHQEVDLTSALKGNTGNFQVRFRFSGSSLTPHNWYLDNIRIWNPVYVEFGGVVRQINNILPNSVITLAKADDPLISYQINSDENGRFYASAVEKGVYRLSITLDGALMHEDTAYSIEASHTNLDLIISGALLEMDKAPISVTMGEGKTKRMNLPVHNAGNIPLNWTAGLKFEKSGTGEEVGESNIEMEPAWEMAYTFELNSSDEKSLICHQGHFYTLTSPLKLHKYTLEGEFVDTEEIVSSFPATGIASDGKRIYLISSTYGQPYKIYPIDRENKTIIEEEALTIPNGPLGRLWYGTYDPITDGFYVGNEHYVHYVDRRNNSTTFTINNIPGSGNSTYAYGIAVDSFTDQGPYLWVISSKDTPAGDIVDASTIFQYSFQEKNLTPFYKPVVELPGYKGASKPSALTTSTSVIPGYLTLSGIVNYNSKATVFTYKMVPFENWLLLDEVSGSVSEESDGDLFVEMKTTMLSEGESREGAIVIRSNASLESFEIPVTLQVDNSMEDKCFVPVNLTTTLTSEYEVALSWEMPAGAEQIKGYNIYRGGILYKELVAERSFTDKIPGIGRQSYTVQALYSFGCESLESEPVEILVENPSIVTPIDHAVAEVINGKHIQLVWDAPYYAQDIVDDFESYRPFIIENIGDWKVYDGDRSWTHYNSSISYTNRGSRMAYMVFNPSRCSPASSVFAPDESKQLLAVFGANVDGLANNDWLISRELHFDRDFTLSFDARTYSGGYPEHVNIGYSFTGNEPEDFIFINGTTPIVFEAMWLTHKYSIPKEAKYIAINCVSPDGWMFLLDNIFIGHPENYAPLTGYNVYRDGVKLNTQLLKEPKLMEYDMKDGEYTYEVEALFENGIVSRTMSNTAVVAYSHNASSPLNLRAEEGKEQIRLFWEAPLWSEEEELRYDDGIPYNSTGGVEEEQLIAVRWSGTDLNVYQDYSFTGVKFHIAEPALYVVPFLFENGTLIRGGKEMEAEPGDYITFEFEAPATIKPNTEYIIGYSFMTDGIDYYPASHDRGPGIAGKSDLISNDGENWFSTYELWGEGFNYNWNIAALIELRGEPETAPRLVLPTNRWDGKQSAAQPQQLKKRTLQSVGQSSPALRMEDKFTGYNIYRNGTKVNPEPVVSLNYTDKKEDTKRKEYYVTAIYAISGEVASNTVVVEGEPTNGIENTEAEQVAVYPNPAKERVYVKGACDRIRLFSADGRLRLETIALKESIKEIALDGMPSGIYIMEILRGIETEHHKIIINKN